MKTRTWNLIVGIHMPAMAGAGIPFGKTVGVEQARIAFSRSRAQRDSLILE